MHEHMSWHARLRTSPGVGFCARVLVPTRVSMRWHARCPGGAHVSWCAHVLTLALARMFCHWGGGVLAPRACGGVSWQRACMS